MGSRARHAPRRLATRRSRLPSTTHSLAAEMLVEWSRDVAGLYRSEYRYSTTSYYTTPQVLDLPSPICGAWTLAFNGDTRRLLLDWEFKDGVYDPLVVGGGSIVARSGTTRLWTIEVPAGNFPPSSCGTYRSNRLPNLHSQVTLTLELFHPAESRWNLPKLIVQTASKSSAFELRSPRQRSRGYVA